MSELGNKVAQEVLNQEQLSGLSEFSTHRPPVAYTPEGWRPPGPFGAPFIGTPDANYVNRTYTTARTERQKLLNGETR